MLRVCMSFPEIVIKLNIFLSKTMRLFLLMGDDVVLFVICSVLVMITEKRNL